MQSFKNKTIATLITLILMSTIAISTIAYLPPASALTHTESNTYSFITVSPNPVGIGQPMTIMFWLVEMNPLSAANQDNVWHNFTLTITKPDGTAETKSTNANSAAGAVIIYAPDQSWQLHFRIHFSWPANNHLNT